MSSIGDEITSSTILTIILGAPIMIGIGILAIPLIIVAGIIGIPISTLIKSLLVFGAAVFFVWLFSRHQIIENGIVGLIAGSLVYSHFKIHPVLCILIGLAAIGLLFLISGFNIGFWIKAIIFSIIISFFVWGACYAKGGLLPAEDNIWSISFFIIFFLENIFIRLSTRYNILENAVPVKEKQKQEIEPTVSDRFVTANKNKSIPIQKKTSRYPKVKLNNYVGNFRLKEKFWDSEAETLIYDALKGFIDDHYVILPHAALREILYWGKWDRNWPLANSVNAMHFDFVIYPKDQHVNRPTLVIEAWGSEHYNDQKTKERDDFKQSVLKKVGVKYIIIDLSQCISDQNIIEKTIECIKNEIPSREHYTVYCPLCSSVMEIKTNSITNKEFYGCTKFNKNAKDYSCKGTRNIIDVPPLYSGIQIKVAQKDQTQTEQKGKISNEK